MNKHAKSMRQAAVICKRAGLVNIAASCENAANEIERLEKLNIQMRKNGIVMPQNTPVETGVLTGVDP